MDELSLYYPPIGGPGASSTCYELELVRPGGFFVEPDDSQDFVEFERTEGVPHKRYFVILGPS